MNDKKAIKEGKVTGICFDFLTDKYGILIVMPSGYIKSIDTKDRNLFVLALEKVVAQQGEDCKTVFDKYVTVKTNLDMVKKLLKDE